LGVHVYEKTRELTRIREKISQVAPATQRAQGQLRQWEALRTAIIGRTPVVDFFDELSRVTPHEIVLTNIRLTASGEVTLQGQSFNPLAVNQFQSKLVSSTWLKNVTLQYATKRMAPGGEVTNFLITAVIKKKMQGQ
jgi:Tfp pilus assembly protein PilN